MASKHRITVGEEVRYAGDLTNTYAPQTGPTGYVAASSRLARVVQPAASFPLTEVALGSPPTITVSAAYASASLTGGTYTTENWFNDDGSVGPLLAKCRYPWAPPSHQDWLGNGMASPVFGGNPQEWAAEFDYDGAVFEARLWLIAGGAQFRVAVDGQYVSTTPNAGASANAGEWYYVKVDFGSAAQRSVRIETYAHRFWQLVRPKAATVSLPTYPRRPRCYVVGDSVSCSTGASSFWGGWHRTFGRLMQWDVISSSLGGTGYVNPGPSNQNAVTIQSRLDSYLSTVAPDVVVLAGGINDTSYTSAQLKAAVTTAIQTVRSAYPTVPVFVVSTWMISTASSGPTLAANAASRADVTAAAVAAGVPVVDPSVVCPITADNVSQYITGDGTHPTQAGHDFYARGVARAISAYVGA